MDRSIDALLQLCTERGMGRHPFLRLTAELPVDMGVLYDFLSNLNLGTSAYPGWLQALSARMPNAPTFRPAALHFLRGLARENTKPWF